ncbi:short-chain dehydrogenase [Rhodococcus sp. SC4]|jgi:NAD(P)-dependent dehydrogenase (short-subunit alcohol dehydrogenase family)|uniref:SDR family NAD(P)-dependent oxidoreductase n=1 Tax=Rhodococcus sp. LB1 TaxID=1807499 RepID=UPI000769B983|nr:SDR family oxidoreductase [Rhodococcus sp. LB1]KXF51070.1 short-chain dehydrogenase [Rhodococcus sp. SC4]KXX56088.1 short-chain dehydrogenase [Rhodococcus sp. LB1]RZK84394.1 MAG: SDR family oxidoreductase [Rhodococcus sp. (in: high G+C Gram-positive bacteria)]
MNRFDNRRILVTGAASGIGQATALRLLEEGGTVVAADVSEDGLARTAELADAAGTAGRLSVAAIDIGDEKSVTDGVSRSVEKLGGLDVLVNAAGILRASHTHETPLDLWNQVIGINLTGTFLMVRECLPALLRNERSVVVNFSSTSAAFAHPYMAAYAASKGGIQSFTHALALEYGKQGLRAVGVAPGSIKTGITDATSGYVPSDADWSLFAKLSPILPTTLESGGAAMGGPEQVAGVVAMLASDDGAFVTGTEIRIDGGTHA